MYESHFGFNGSPFQLNPDPAFYFDSRGHSNALAYLKFGAHQGEGFIVVTGEIGAGKTTLVRTLLEGLDPEKVVAAQVVSTQLESGELLQAILMSFGIASSSNSKAHLIGSLEAFLTSLAARGRRALLIIDEAQNLKHEAVEELRMLSNFQLGKYGLLQSFLVGQPELRQLLQSKSMEQLRQRVIASCHLGPLQPAETRAYIEHRLRRVGWASRPEFMPDAFERIHLWTGGVPRKINRLCNRLLLGAFLANEELISSELVDRTANELKSEIGELAEIPDLQAVMDVPEQVERAAEKRETVSQSSSQSSSRSLPAAAVETSSAHVAHADAMPTPETRPKVRLLPAAGPAPLAAEVPRPTAAAASRTEVLPPVARSDRPSADGKAANRVETWVPLTVVPAVKPGAPVAEAPAAAPAPTMPAAVVATYRIQRTTYRPTTLHRPLLCLVDTVSDFLKAGTLTEVFLKFPGLPQVVAVHPGAENQLSFGDTGANELPMPFAGVHLEPSTGSMAFQTRQMLEAFEEVLNEHQPPAILVMGNSDAVLACSLLATKRGVPLFRIGGGQGPYHLPASEALNGSLIDKISDSVYVHRMDSYYTLYLQGIGFDRVLCVGNLVADTLKYALPHAPSPSEILTATGMSPSVLESPSGFALVDVEPASALFAGEPLGRLVSLLCELAGDMPLVWPTGAEGVDRLKAEGHAERLEASGIIVIPVQGYLQRLGLLEMAKCLVAVGQSELGDEACSLQVPTLRIAFDASKGSFSMALADSEGAIPAGASAQGLLSTLRFVPDSPSYWDVGAATRIANHLGPCLSKMAAGQTLT